MTTDTIDRWLEGFMQDCTRWNIVFAHLGDAFPESRAAIISRMESVVNVNDYLREPQPFVTLRLVSDLEELASGDAAGLGQLRERVFTDRDNGTRVVLLSRRPLIAFPNVPGSSVLRDAKLILPPSYLGDHEKGPGFGVESLVVGTPIEVVISQALRELGPEVCASVDAAVFEGAGDDMNRLASLEDAEMEALLSSGLVASDHGALTWAFSNAGPTIRASLEAVIAGMRGAQNSFPQVSTDCWALERLIRQALRSRARTVWGEQWKTELLSADLRGASLQRANVGAYVGAESVQDLRDPLEWLTLDEILLTRSNSGVGSLGVLDHMWNKLRTELLPIKDRIERSQLVRKHDVDITSRWAAVLSDRLSLSGSPSPEEALADAPLTQRELMKKLRADLSQNSRFSGDVEKDLMSIVTASVRFLAHTLDSRPNYAAELVDKKDAPLERVVQDAYKAFLDMSQLAGRAAIEVSSIGAGRADVVLYLDDGTRYITEVKRELDKAAKNDLEASYLAQTVAYQSANVPFGQLLVLDLTERDDPSIERLDRSMWVAHKRDEDGIVIASTVVTVVRGNRPTPSKRK
jgi:hypothetical protein